MASVMKKRKCQIEDVHINNIAHQVASPLLVTFRTCQPQNCKMEARLFHERFTDGDCTNRMYHSKLIVTGGEQEFMGQGQRVHTKNRKDEEITLVGILDKTSNKMKLVELQKFTVNKTLKATSTSQLNATAQLPTSNVTMAFGTKKNIIHHTAMLKQKERQEAGDGSAMQSAISTMKEEKHVPMAVENYDYILPPINEQATTALQVYSMATVVTDDVLYTLIERAKAVLKEPAPTAVNTSLLIRTCLASARLEPENSVRVKHTCVVLYMEYLLKVLSNTIFTRDLQPLLRNHMENQFGNLKYTSSESCDKALAHLLVLGMLVNNCRIPMDAVTSSVTFTKDKILKFTQVLRFKVRAGHITLQVPLPAESLNRYKRFSLNKIKRH